MDIKKILLFTDSPKNQFITGLILNLLFVSLLLSFSTSSYNVRAPKGIYSNNIWEKSDVHTYTDPALQFLEKGSFNSGNIPDFHRTVGYPFFLSFFMKISGDYWNLAVIFAQALLFAFIYPVIYRLLLFFFPGYSRLPSYTFIFLILAGTFIPYTAFLYTDTIFALTFLAGILFCIIGIEKNSALYIMLELILTGFAAEIRPTLAVFPLLNILIIIYFSRRIHGYVNRFAKQTLVVSTVILLVLCNGPAIRNYYNYGIFFTTDVLHNNLTRYLAKHVMHDLGRDDEYKRGFLKVTESENLIKKAPVNDAAASQLIRNSLLTKDTLSRPILKAHPLLTIKWITSYGLYNSFDYHWGNVFNYWNMHWHKDPKFQKISRASILLLGLWGLIYLALYSLFVIFIIKKIAAKEYIFLGILFLIFLPFFASFLGGGGARMRLSVEWIIAAAAFLQISMILKNRSKSGEKI